MASLPLPRLVRLMWRSGQPGRSRQLAREARITRLVSQICNTSGGNCLERSLILYRYLSEAGASPELVVAVARPGVYLGHVWVVVDGAPRVDSPRALAGYMELLRFGDAGARLT